MESEAITMELEQSSAPKRASVHIEQTNATSSISYLPGTMQSLVDDLLAEMLQMDDPFEQMNFIILKLMPAVLAEQEQSIEAIAPLIESNKEYNERLATLQGDMANWGESGEDLTGEKSFFTTKEELETKLEADTSYGVQEEMLDSLARIDDNVLGALGRQPDQTYTITEGSQMAWNSLQAPTSAYVNGKLDSYPSSSSTIENYDKGLNNTGLYQPLADQTTQELEILKGLNVNMAKQMELDLKYKVEFYNSYVTSIGSMEDNTSKQRRAPIDRLKS